jgi:arabinoxylan arabinofuranohydrolase
VFVDDDGTGYLTYGGGEYNKGDKVNPGGARIVKLTDNMIGLADKPVHIDAPYMFEDSGINKIGDKYYFSYCSSWEPRNDEYKTLGAASIAYMTSDSPTGPYKFEGEILPNCGEVFENYANNHHSIIDFKGKYYMFYHTLVLENKSRPKVWGYRNCQANDLTVNSDGTLKQVDQDMAGVKQISNFDPYKLTTGTTFCDSAGMTLLHGNKVEAEAVESDKYKYSWTYIKGADFGKESPKSITAKFRLDNNITFKVCADSVSGPEIASTTIKASSDGMYTISIPVNEITGIHDVYFVLLLPLI